MLFTFRIAPIVIACFLAFVPQFTWGQDHSHFEIIHSLERARENIHSLKCEVTADIQICKGAYNRDAWSRAPDKAGSDVPSTDQTITIEKEFLFDFANRRYAAKGYDYHAQLKKDGDLPTLDLFREWSSTAYSNNELSSLTPRDKIDKRSIPPGIEFPVEYSHMKFDDGGSSVEFVTSTFPMFFVGGAVPDPRLGITAKDLRPPQEPSSLSLWKVERVKQDQREVLRLTSPPGRQGGFNRICFDPALAFSVVSWEANDGSTPRAIIEIVYDQSHSLPALMSWSVKTYGKGTALQTQEDFRVISLVMNPTLSDDMFALQPQSGMVVESRQGKALSFSVAGERMSAGDNYTLNHMIAEKSRWWYMITIAGIVVFLVCIAFTGRWMYRRSTVFHA